MWIHNEMPFVNIDECIVLWNFPHIFDFYLQGIVSHKRIYDILDNQSIYNQSIEIISRHPFYLQNIY